MTDSNDSNNQKADSSKQVKDEKVAELERIRKEILSSDPEVVISNHCFGLFELAAIYLSENPPRLASATLAIDALAGLTESIKGRLGEHEPEIVDALSQLRLAFVQVSALAAKPPQKD